MSRIRLFAGLALAALTDFAAGVVITYGVGKASLTPLPLWLYVVGGLVALSPDIDILLYALARRWGGVRWQGPIGDHRDILHYPLPLIGACAIVAYGASPFWGSLVGLCLTAHFLDDTTDPGGIRWLWPFTARKFQLFATEREPLSLPQWVERCWLRPSYKSVSGILLIVTAGVLVIIG